MTDAGIPMGEGRALALALRFHDTYERLAPSFGYETRPDTKAFDPTSPNGKLMIAVCGELLTFADTPPPAAAGDRSLAREAIARIIDPEGMKSLETLHDEWAKWAAEEHQDFGDGPNKIDLPAMMLRMAQSDYEDRARKRDRALVKADAILALRTPEPNSDGEASDA